MQTFIFIASILFIAIIIYNIVKRKKSHTQPSADTERKILQQYVQFYQRLNEEEKTDFEERVRGFLQSVRITAIETIVEDMDRVFVAAGAIIPIFTFKEWEYRNIHEVLIYPNSFNEKFQLDGQGSDILGMVGNGAMQNTMILSKPNLRDGFVNTNTKSNAVIHEFVHLIDKEDGSTDGCPENLLPHKYALPWLKRIHMEMKLIQKGKSDINPYAATSEAEFLAVASEYFFEQPQLMERKHPDLYNLLKQVFIRVNKKK